ncbi:non-heme iron oxygenase ferredoxin subunit [Pseudonocardia sp. CA-107938]|uniref:non-heme iron oxygenase ferredoxin subunit n=1 Tax=Pseudonocardia sp. CA-107938 TaxID=3240021 RepID=UPI003D901BEF
MLTTWHREVLAAILRWPWLRTAEQQVSAVVEPLYDRHRDALAVELMHGGRWAGHSVHAALSDLPIGFYAGALVLDAFGGSTPGRPDPAATLSAAGIAAAAITAATGVTDWAVSDGDDRRVGLLHGLLNGAATVLQAASLTARVRGHRRPAQALGAASMAVTAAAGYLGGHLVQGRAVMVNRALGGNVPSRWVRALPEPELPDGGIAGVDVDGRKVLLHRAGADVHAIDDLCSHAGALLSRGEVTGCVVTCPLHASRFDLRDGHVVRGPAHHPQPVLPARIRNGWIEVRGAEPRRRGSG